MATTECYRCKKIVPLGGGRMAEHLESNCQGFPCNCGLFFKTVVDRSWHRLDCDGRRPPQRILWEVA